MICTHTGTGTGTTHLLFHHVLDTGDREVVVAQVNFPQDTVLKAVKKTPHTHALTSLNSC